MTGAGFALRGRHQFLKDAASSGVVTPAAARSQCRELFLQRAHRIQSRAHASELLVDQLIDVTAVGRGPGDKI